MHDRRRDRGVATGKRGEETAAARRRHGYAPRRGQDMRRIPIEARAGAPAPAWIEVDLEAIAHNVRAFRSLLRPGCRLIAVVKANAYGHGMVPVARAALAAGAGALAVANVREGEALRAAGVAAEILVVGPVDGGEAKALAEFDLVPGIGSRDLLRALAALPARQGRPRPVHVEVDTGMRRHGVPAAELPGCLRDLHDRGRLALAGVFTHFAAVDRADADGMQAQFEAFRGALALVRDLGTPLRHAANTLATLLLPEAQLDAVRIGGGIYGFDPLHGGGPVRLRPALALKARLVGLRQAAPGDGVGYGSTFVCRRPTRLGLLPLGYADGLVRASWQGAAVLVRGQPAPIVGLVSMNQTVIDVTDVPAAAVGDEVVLLGRQGERALAAEDRLGAGGSVYEITSLLAPGLPRVCRGAAAAAVDLRR
ncbi:MAG: alanine racemase [Planctomycetes bacterium]|nr:alanine racemase [Planctomycetota bacterium]